MLATRGVYIPGRFWLCLRVIFLSHAAFVFSACGKVSRPVIGSTIDSPIALASHPSLPVTYALNAVLGGEFETGSLHTYSMAENLTPQLLSTEVSPRLGTALAVAKTGGFLIAGFSGSMPELLVFKIDAQGVAKKSELLSDRVTLPRGKIGTLQLVQLPNQQDWLVVVSFADRSYEAQFLIYQYSESLGFKKLFSSPDDFYQPNRENPLGAYSLAWGSPVVFESLGLLVAFPYGTVGYFGINPPAFEWLTGRVMTPNPTSDLRTVSSLLVDLYKLLSTAGNSQGVIGFAPIAFNNEGKSGNPNLEVSSAENKTLAFRISYQSAIAIDSSGSRCLPSSPMGALLPNTAVVALDNQHADLIALGGFDNVAVKLRERLQRAELQPVLGQEILAQPVLVKQESSETDFKMLIPKFQLIQSGSLCTLAWLRVEQRRSSLGFERSWLQIATQSSGAQLELQSQLSGLASFAVSGSKILTGSFGTNQIQQFNFDGKMITEGDIR